jgi:hypothetical protein
MNESRGATGLALSIDRTLARASRAGQKRISFDSYDKCHSDNRHTKLTTSAPAIGLGVHRLCSTRAPRRISMTSQSKKMEKQTARSLAVLVTTTLAAQRRISPDQLRAHHALPITDGPFAETKELLGGRTPVNAKRRR